MKNFFKRQKGSVSIYFMIVSLIFFLFSTVLIDFMRILVAERKLEHATKVAAESVMTNFNSEVRAKYGLFAFDGDTGLATEMATTITTENLSLEKNFFNIAELSSPTSTVDFMKYEGKLGLSSEETLKQQMLESVKYKGPLAFGEETFEIFDFFTSNGRDTKALKKMMKEQKKIKKEMEKRFENIKEVEEELKNVRVSGITFKNADLSSATVIKANQAIFVKMYFVQARESFENKQGKVFKQAYENEADEELKAKLKIRMDQHQVEMDKIEAEGNLAESMLQNEIANIDNKITELTSALAKLDSAHQAVRDAIVSNEEIRNKLGNLSDGDSEEINAMREAIQKAYVEPEKLGEMTLKIEAAQGTYQGYKTNLESLKGSLTHYLSVSLVNGTDKNLANDKTKIEVTETSMQEEIEKKVKERVAKNKNHAQNVHRTISRGDIDGDIVLIKNTEMAAAGTHIEKVVELSKEKDVRQELTEDEKQQEAAEKEKTASGMTQFNAIVKVINTAKKALADEQEIYDNLNAIMASNASENQNAYPEGKAPSSDADDLIDQSFDLLDTLTTMGNSLKNKALLNEYLLGEIGTNQPVSLFDAVDINPENVEGLLSDFQFKNKQVEYLMYGQSTPGVNYAATLLELIMIRLVCNLISGAFDKNVKAAFSINVLVGLATLVSYTIMQTVADVLKLTKSDETERDEKEVAFFKIKFGVVDLSKIKLTYRDHLRLMLLFERKNQYARAIAVIEQQSGQKGIGVKPTQIKVTNTAKIKPWFLPNAVKTFTNLDSKLVDGEIELKTELYYSY